MAYILIINAALDRPLARTLEIELQNAGYALWREDASHEDQLALDALREVVESAQLVVFASSGQAPRDERLEFQLRVAQASAKPILTIRSADRLPDLQAQLRQFVLPSHGRDAVLLPQPISTDQIDEMNAQAAGEMRRARASSGLIIAAVLVVIAGIALMTLFPLLRAPLASLFGGETEPTAAATIQLPASPTLIAPTAAPTDLPTLPPTLTPVPPTETSALIGIVTFTPTPQITATLTPAPTDTATPVPPTDTAAPTSTSTPVPTDTPTPTPSPSSTLTPTLSATATPIAAGADNRAWTLQLITLAGLPSVIVPAGCATFTDDTPTCFERYAISATEITNGQYALCVEAGACVLPLSGESRTRTDYYTDARFADYPVIYVTWEQARAYAAWIGGALPTFDQWRYAAAGAANWSFPWGVEAPNQALLNFNGFVGDTTRTGEYPAGASWVGAFDLAGNVWEWTATTQGADRVVVAGGSWTSYAGLVGTDITAANPPDDANAFTGFRVVFDVASLD